MSFSAGVISSCSQTQSANLALSVFMSCPSVNPGVARRTQDHVVNRADKHPIPLSAPIFFCAARALGLAPFRMYGPMPRKYVHLPFFSPLFSGVVPHRGPRVFRNTLVQPPVNARQSDFQDCRDPKNCWLRGQAWHVVQLGTHPISSASSQRIHLGASSAMVP